MIIYLHTREYPDAPKVIELIFRAIPGFEPLTPGEIKLYRSYLRSNRTEFTFESMISLRTLLATHKTQQAIRALTSGKIRIADPGKQITKDIFRNNPEIPPLHLLSILGKSRKIPEDIQKLALKLHSENPDTAATALAQSEAYEAEVAELLSGIAFKTEKQLRIDGKPGLPTPDFLFAEPQQIKIDNIDHLINWMDVKNYMYIDLSFITNRLIDQATRYISAFGPGLFLFRHGYFKPSLELRNTGVLLADAYHMECV